MRTLLSLLTLLLMLSASGMAIAESSDFRALLEEAGMRYEAPSDYRELPLEPSPFGYEKRLGHKEQQIEVRYSIRPIGRIRVDYEDPHNSAPHPNDLFDMLFRSVVEQFSAGPDSVSQAYPPQKADALFNAGWAAVSVMDINPEISTLHRQGILLAIHRNDRADAYLLFLTNDLDAHKPYFDALVGSLVFRDDA